MTGLDMTPHLLEEARARAAREGLRIRFDEGFAETLPYPDASFDVLVSMFGITFSPLPVAVVSEMARVLRPGGRLALANWTRSGFGGKMSAVVARYLPPPPQGTVSPFLWGDEATVRDRLKPALMLSKPASWPSGGSCREAPPVRPNSSQRMPAQFNSRSVASMPLNRLHSCTLWSNSG